MEKQRLFVYVMTLILLGTLTAPGVLAQEEPGSNGPGMGLGLSLGTQSFLEDGEKVVYQKVGFIPDISFGKFGVSLDLSFHLASSDDPNAPFKFRKDDWVPTGDRTFLELYLPKINYIRYGVKGEPFYVKFGSISDGTLGTGFIMGNYSNRLFLPDEKILGMSLDLDGKLFDFPYFGIETNVGNLAHFDVMGGRLYLRPLAWSTIPLLKDIEIGSTAVVDLDPDYRSEFFTAYNLDKVDSVFIMGADIIQPILTNPAFSLSLFGDFVVQPNEATGFMAGFSGRLIQVIPYVFQLRFLGKDFIPTYFDATYDLYRAKKYLVASGETSIPEYQGWFGSLGFSLLEDKLAFQATVDGPFKAIPEGDTADKSASQYPHLRAVFTLAEGILPGVFPDVFLDAFYDKKYITSIADVVDPEGAVIGLNINYRTGPAVITLAYDVRYNPSTEEFDTSAKLMTAISLF